MRKSFRKSNSSSWMKFASVKRRGSAGSLIAAAGGLERWQRWAIGALLCATTIGSISLVAHTGGRAPKKEETKAASDTTATAEATTAKSETKNAEASATAHKSAPKATSGGTTAMPKKAGKAAGKTPTPKPQGQVIAITPAAKSETKGEDEHEEDNVRARAQWFHDQRAYPLQHIPAGALQRALQQRDAMKQRQKASSGLHPASVITFPGDGLWHLTGPQPTNRPFGNFTGAGNSGFPTSSGRVTAIAVDPSDATGNTVYIGGAAGGVWKTTDGGTTWKSLTDTQPSLAIGSIAIDPNNHLTIYVGTGEDDFNHDGYYGAGILKSTDGGNTWAQLGASIFAVEQAPGVGGAQVGAIAVQPGNSNVVLAAVDFFDGNDPKGGIYQSVDGGTTWIRPAAGAQGSAGTGVVFEPTSVASSTGAIAYAALGDIFSPSATNNGIWKSTDSGAHWTKQTGGLPTTNVGRITLGYAPSTSSALSGATIYAAIADSSTTSGNLLGFFRTTNGGTAWSQLSSTPAFCNSQCFYDIAVGVHPTNPNVVVVGGGAFTDNFTSLFETTDGGTTWTGTGTNDFSGPNGGTHPHVDTHAIVFTPNGITLRLYIGNDGGMWRTDNPLPAGVSPTWVNLNTQLAITQFYPNPSVGLGDDNSAFGGTQDNDTQVFSGTLDWTAVQACGDGASTAVDTLYPTTVYTTCAPGSGPGLVARSVFNGAVLPGPNPSFAPVDTGITTEKMEFTPPLAIDGNNSATVYFATCRLWQTTNGQPTTDTTTWTAITGDLASGTNTLGAACGGAGDITSMDVSHQSSGIVFAGTSNGKVWKTLDATAGTLSTWTEFDNGLLPNRFVTAVRTERSDSTGNIAFVTFSGFGSCAVGCDGKGHVFATTNGGTTWSDISGDLPDAPVNDILVYHQGSPTFDALYIATDVGVFSCENPTAATPCQNWTVIGDGLPNSPVLGLAMRRSSRILRAFTHGRSAWHIQLTDVQPPAVSSLGSLTPAAVMVGAATTQVTVTGVNFSSNTQLLFGGIVIPTTFVNTTQLTASVNTNLFTTGIVYNATVNDPAGADTGSLPFTVMNPVPTLTGGTVSSPTLTNDPITLQFTGTNFVPGTVVTFNNLQVFGGTPSAGGTIFTVTVPAVENTTAGSIPVAIYNPLPGGGFAGGANITVTANPLVFNPSPIIQLGPINVGTTTAVKNISITNVGGTAISISAQSITGTNAANFNFAAPTSGTSCNFPTSGQSGTGPFTLTAGGGTCNFGMTFFANPATGNVDSTATLNVTDTAADSPQHIPIIGLINGANNLVTLSPVAFGGIAVGTTSPTMNATLFNLSNTPVNVTTAFTIAGTNQADFHLVPFVASGDGNAACPTTIPFALGAFLACDTSLTFTPSLPAGNETATINVTTSASGTPLSANLTGTGIELTSISPSVVATGGPAFTLTVNGGGFAQSAVVNVNGSARLTTFVSATELLASMPASDISTPGSLAISVTTPVPGGTTSEPKTLIVAQASPGTNDNINFATNAVATLPFRITEDTTQATVNTGGVNDPTPACAPGTATQGGKARSVWFTATPPVSGRVIFDTRFSSYTTIVSGWTGTPGSLVAVPGACFSGNVAGTTPATLVGVPVTAGTKYYMMVSDAGATGTGGTLTFSLDFQQSAPANDDNATPTVIAPASLPYSNTVNTIQATANTNGHADPALPAGCATGAASSGQANSVWYSFTPTSSGTVTADTLTSPYDTILNVTSGSPTGTQVACNNDAGTGIAQSQVSFAAASGTTYFFMVSSFLGDGGTTNFHLTANAGGAGIPASIIATSGTPQNAAINTAFAAPLVATVKDSLSNPVSGAIVTFTPPGSGASGTFAGGVNTATTNASGVATSAVFTANATAGGPYNVAATVGGVATPANFALTNKAGAAAKVAATSGSGQSATINTAFAAPLVATVTDAGNNPVSGVVVTFTPPGSGASGTFAGGVNTATTNASGVATSAVFTANATAGGPYNVVASATGATSANFSLTNTAGTAAKVAVTSGSGQSATISTAFAAPLVATVTDAGNNPVSGVVVTFTPPGSGASGTFAGGVNTATTNASGVATSATFSANATAGGPYNVVASATGATSANFSLTNKAGAAAKVTATSGTPQSTAINTAFAAPLVATVTDAGNNPVSGVVVTFMPPGSGASGTFAGGVNTATTNASGVATSVVFTANATAGGPYNVVASATGATSANFSLTNTSGTPAKVAATSGTPQGATINTAFAAPLVATVTDAGNNPVSGVVVTFTPPGSGASGTFAGGVNTATTNASGVATSVVFTANATAGGPYNVVASATGATSANFSLTNTAGTAAKVAVTSGSGQSTTISTAFAAPLVATVTDSGNNPVSGAVVTFTPPGSGASGTFAGGVNTATTNASGVASSAVFTANATAGGPYNVVASATGATSANFSLTNKAGAAATVAVTSGSGQSATISTAFAAPLVATVTDSGNNPVSGVVVTFTPPGSGASGTFAGGMNTATTNASGVATSAVFTANATAGGPYNVVASATGATSANFSLTNKAGAAAKVAATSGSGQITTISTAFAAPLVATVTDSGNNPVGGVVVTFTPPGSGASGTFAGGVNTATTNASGVATSAVFTANATAGGPYNVVASATGATSANFTLTNTSTPPGKVAITTGSGQSAAINTAFGAPFVVTVTDASNNPVSGAVVTFTPPASGASGTFAGGVNTATTSASGVATSAVFTANATAGAYNVVASSPNDTSANFALTNTVGPAAKVTATSGTPQSAAINTAFAAPLVATVTDAGNNPVSGVVVTFTPPASGASGTFAGGVNTATTNASGVATSAVFTANLTAGGPYNIVASAIGATSANFALTNNAGPAAKVAATSGSGQSTTINTAFAAPLVATVTDAGNNPVSGVVVTFAPPASGASGSFAGGVNTATTNASGVATSAVFTANATAGGPYNVVASATGATSANFALTNKTGAAANVVATSGTPQSVVINTAFAAPLVATVTDAGNNPVSGVVVTFTPPTSGASGAFAGGVNTATTNASGVATSAVFTANATAGGPYNVVASATGATSANFSLTNLTGNPASVTATAGTPQGTPINTAFTTQLQATVKDAGSNPVSGVVVTFTAPASGASGTFAGGVNTATTNASGVATAPVLTANGTVGAYTVNATVAGVAAPAPFLLTNNAGPAASITATAGTPQNAVINTAFAALLQATVKDAGSNPVSGVVVTFTAPSSGASGTFAGGVTTATTNASGVATAAAFTANATAGSYTVTAKVSGVANGANFSLTNNPGPPASITATAGTPQTTTINTAFSTQLQATVKDAGNNLVSGAIVTFTAPASGASGGFAGGVNTATTNASGVATAPVFTANGTAGGPYTVTAKVAGVATTANFSLTNNNVQPTLASLLPASTLAGGAAFPLTINGNGFVNGATVGFGADAALVPTTTTATQIVVNIPPADIAKAGQIMVTVTNPPPSVGPSSAQTFTVNNPVPTLTTLGQTHIAGGAAFTLTVNGTNFVSTSVVNFGTKTEPTTLVSPTQVTAAIPATDVSSAGPVNVTVTNPAPGGGPTPTSIAFTVDGFSLAGPGTAVTVTAGMTATIPITITPTANGFANQVTFSVTGLPAHASLVPINATPGNAKSTVNLMITTTKRSAAPPVSPMDQPLTPMLRMLLVSWFAALLAGLYAALLIRRAPRLRRYAAIIPLVLLLISGAVLAGCASAMNGTPVGTSQLTITATSGTLSQSTVATLTVQ